MRQALPPRRPRTKSTTRDNALSRRNRTNTKVRGSSSLNAILKMDGDSPQINTTKSSPRAVGRSVLGRKNDLPAPRLHRPALDEGRVIPQIVYRAPSVRRKVDHGGGRGPHPLAASSTPRTSIPAHPSSVLWHVLFGYLTQQTLHDAAEAQHGRGGGKMPLGVILTGTVRTPRFRRHEWRMRPRERPQDEDDIVLERGLNTARLDQRHDLFYRRFDLTANRADLDAIRWCVFRGERAEPPRHAAVEVIVRHGFTGDGVARVAHAVVCTCRRGGSHVQLRKQALELGLPLCHAHPPSTLPSSGDPSVAAAPQALRWRHSSIAGRNCRAIPAAVRASAHLHATMRAASHRGYADETRRYSHSRVMSPPPRGFCARVPPL